ncbi:restriction endonuclease [Marinomonas sp. 2405UD68-3]|uniref:restriction endonuclease n=1 Tax=Marinomonas sp. 2405UD68-3 TaxID=3391835 RepID=UPI0039C9B454
MASFADLIRVLENIQAALVSIEFIVVAVVIFFLVLFIRVTLTRRSYKQVRPNTKAQKIAYGNAKKAIRVIKRSDEGEGIRALNTLNGFAFELLCLQITTKSKGLTFIATPKLTNDGGIDGIIIASDVMWVLQAKHYTGYVNEHDITSLSALTRALEDGAYRERKSKLLGVNGRRLKQVRLVKAIFVTSGKVSKTNIEVCHLLNIRLVQGYELLSAIRAGQSVID